jgi:hypothetical protein
MLDIDDWDESRMAADANCRDALRQRPERNSRECRCELPFVNEASRRIPSTMLTRIVSITGTRLDRHCHESTHCWDQRDSLVETV